VQKIPGVSQLFELKVAKGDEVLHINAVVGEHNADVAGDEEDEIKVEKIIKQKSKRLSNIRLTTIRMQVAKKTIQIQSNLS